MEKAIEQKLADARAQSDKKDVNPPGDKTSDDSKKAPNSTTKKDDGKESGQKAANASVNNDGKKASSSGTAVKKPAIQTAATGTQSGTKNTGSQSGANAKKPEGKVTNQKATNTGKAPPQKATGSASSPKKVAAKPSSTPKASDSGSQSNSNTSKDGTKPQSGSNVAKKVGGESSKEVKMESDSDKNRKAEQKDKAKDDKSKTDKSNGDRDTSSKNDDKKKDPTEKRDDPGERRSRRRSRSKSSRERSRSPMLFQRNYHYARSFDPDHPRRKFDERNSSYRRSPDRRRSRTRSPLPPRRRSRSPYARRSPSPRRYDSRRRSPRRRSRNSQDRTRSRSRSRRDRSRSSDRNRDPKVLRAKKSFLDDLAVKFAQEGREFPELEQYRCEINSQFVQYPQFRNQFSINAVEHPCDPPYMDMDGCPPGDPMGTQIVLADPYNAYPLYAEAQPIVSYPMLGEQLALQSPALDSPQASQEAQFQQDKINGANSGDRSRSTGSQPSVPTEIWTKQEVKLRIKQAIKLLEDADSGKTKPAKFLYRAPTFHGKGINEGRSPVLKSDKNPTYAFSCRFSETSDPFGNVPRTLKPIIDVLRMDEGHISYRILQRHNLKQQAVITERDNLARRQQGATTSNTGTGSSLQKTTQTDPTVCTDCLLRKIKVRYNGETQTDIVRTVDSVAQTNPMPVQAVSEFGSITELTPNQVRAVSELIKYIKLTVTSGTVTEMRDSLRDDQVYNLNSDLRTAYNYFDAMVEHKNSTVPSNNEREVGNVPFDKTDDYTDPDTFIEDENFTNEYEEIHKNFCDDEFAEGEELESYSNPLLQSQQTSSHRNMDTRDSYGRNTGSSFGRMGGNPGGPSTSAFRQQQHRPGDRREATKGPQFVPFNRRNY
ncbi:uncharacterized protein LOC5575802 isoform X1 [Aedes aegypti]|uniref:Uncharacterized protein n=1 Tax=Aedes aegypti TaxID=7159 RepID=A0A6I8TRT0_AEDAE|nr:uncharacterized protein LOC5575802 isoform X1 [Aedes aegypti]